MLFGTEKFETKPEDLLWRSEPLELEAPLRDEPAPVPRSRRAVRISPRARQMAALVLAVAGAVLAGLQLAGNGAARAVPERLARAEGGSGGKRHAVISTQELAQPVGGPRVEARHRDARAAPSHKGAGAAGAAGSTPPHHPGAAEAPPAKPSAPPAEASPRPVEASPSPAESAPAAEPVTPASEPSAPATEPSAPEPQPQASEEFGFEQ